MIQCQQCGQVNSTESNFCRGCGLRFTMPQPQPQPQTNYEYTPPRPYSWKTDEFQTNAEARKTINSANQPVINQPTPQNTTLAYQQPQPLAHGYRCPNCGSNYLPISERRISTAGWITFAVLLVTTGVFFWIGLLIREDVSVCPVCKRKVN
jgi:RNA polymerase subunit RPABC4/transcription elongation factor Spt4